MEVTDEIIQLKTDLSKALERKEFRLHFQPKLDLVTGKIKEVEALIRWQHPKKGLIPPAVFISVAEETGLIIPIGEWVLRTACLQNKAWQEAGLPPMVMAINLSVYQLYQADFVDMIRGILDETKLDPEYLELEITESMMMENQHALPIIKELKSLHVQISLDDFGTGYNSLHYLNEFPIDKIKIDRSFIRNCTQNSNDMTIVKMIIEMARQLNIAVVAEGIESKEQLMFLQQCLCDYGQGFLFSKPLPPDELIQHFYEIEQIFGREGIPQELYNRKLMDEALEMARHELHDSVRQQQGMIFKVIKKDGRFIHTLCEGELLYQMGLTPEQVIGKEPIDFLPADTADRKIHCFRRVWNGEENITYEAELNGIYYLAYLRPVRRRGKVTAVIGSCVDITEQKRVEEALRLSELKYRLIAENMHDLIAKLDHNGIVHYASPSYEKVLGIPPDAVKGTFVFDLIHPEDLLSIQTKFCSLMLTKTFRVEFRYKHANGGWIHVEAQVTPVFDNLGEIDYFIAVMRNISERKKAEELNRKSEKLSVIGQLGSCIAHEIRNPLTSIKGFAQLLQKDDAEPLYINTILNEIQKLEDLVQEFLILSKPQRYELKEVDVQVLLQTVLSFFDAQTMNRNAAFTFKQEYRSDLPLIYCDENQIKQVFTQIIQNAVDAMPEGGVIMIRILKHDSDAIKITITDQGYGISEKRIQTIGEPFYSTNEKGTGLGLMISHMIVKDHGGTIDIQSMISEGTTVSVILPIKQSFGEEKVVKTI